MNKTFNIIATAILAVNLCNASDKKPTTLSFEHDLYDNGFLRTFTYRPNNCISCGKTTELRCSNCKVVHCCDKEDCKQMLSAPHRDTCRAITRLQNAGIWNCTEKVVVSSKWWESDK